jgi:hypothetical protein
MRKRVNWVLDADIRDFFGALDHGWPMEFIQHRIADRQILRLIQKWLTAGVSEDGAWVATEKRTPQGAVASPLLANVYLHYVFDLWVRRWRRQTATGDMIVVRYADDIVLGFEHRADAERFLGERKDRMRSFGLEIHPDKTRLIELGRHAIEQRTRRGEGKPYVRLPGVYAHLRYHTEDRPIHRQNPDDPQTPLGKAESAEGGASTSVAYASPTTRAVAALGGTRLVQLPRGAG